MLFGGRGHQSWVPNAGVSVAGGQADPLDLLRLHVCPFSGVGMPIPGRYGRHRMARAQAI